MTAQDWVGRVIDGRYVVEALVGRGGMGVVLAARHKFTGARVAVKMVRADLGIDAEIEARFQAEARIPETIGHRSVVKTLDAGKTAEGELYLVMELLAGRSLRHEIMRGVGAPSVRRIGMELLDVLAAAHARGIVHRDVKPENVFLVEPDASVKLLDFGITKVLAGSRSVLPRTAAGVLLGTIEYMPPEQLADARAVDARADLWAVSVILYEMLAGRRPHRATTVEEMFTALVRGRPDPIRVALPSATPDIEAFFTRALEREPERRFATAAEMAVALARLPLAVAVSVANRPATGNVTMATGFTATPHSMVQPVPAAPQSPVHGVPAAPPVPAGAQPPVHGVPALPNTPGRSPARVLTPFVATPALAGALPDPPPPPAAFPPPAPPAPFPPPAPPAPFAPPQAMPSYARSGVAPAPTTGTIATVARTIETQATRPRRRFGLVLGAVAAVALGAGVVVMMTGGHPAAPSSPVAPTPEVARPPAVAPSPPVAREGSQSIASAASPSAPSPAPQPEAASAPGAPAAPAATAAVPTARASSHGKPSSTAKAPASSPTPRGRHAAPSKALASEAADRPAVTAAAPPAVASPAVASPAVASPAAASPAAASPAAAPRAPASPAATPAAAQRADVCTAGCKTLAGCRLGSSSCEADCAQNRTLHNCLQLAANDCTRFASCWFGTSCRLTPSGTHSCSEAMDCEARCRNESSCICSCVGGLSPAHAVALLAYNGCALGCRDSACIEQRCAQQARRCRAE